MEHEKLCEFCGERFLGRRSDARFCSSNCRQRAGYQRRGEEARVAKRAWVENNPEKRAEILARFAENHPSNGKDRYARLKSDPERWLASQKRQRESYLAHRTE